MGAISETCNFDQIILEIFDILLNIFFITSKTEREFQ